MWQQACSGRNETMKEAKPCSIRVGEFDVADLADRMVAGLLKATHFLWVSDIGAYVKSIEEIVGEQIASHLDIELRRPARLAYRGGVAAGVRGGNQYVGDCHCLSRSEESVLLLKKIWILGFEHGRSIFRWASEDAGLRSEFGHRMVVANEE